MLYFNSAPLKKEVKSAVSSEAPILKTLSDKIIQADNKKKDNGFYWEKDVREAVKNFRAEFNEDDEFINNLLKKHFGSKLI